MKFKLHIWAWAMLICSISQAQMDFSTAQIHTSRAEVEAHLRFLSSDELMGRRTGEAGNNIAARYLASHFQAYGLQQVDGASGYYQPIHFKRNKPPRSGAINWKKETYNHGENLVILRGPEIDTKAEVVFVGYGLVNEEKGVDDYKDLDVKGKIVVVNFGMPGVEKALANMRASQRKRQLASERGALALIELYRLSFPWRMISRFAKRGQLESTPPSARQENDLVYGWLYDKDAEIAKKVKAEKKISWEISCSGSAESVMPSQNVAAWVEGTDPELKKEFVVLSAHYDHVGTGRNGGQGYSQEDSIFNGARDNAIGTTALLTSAKHFALHPPKRSMLFLAVTGEEMGLLGSEFYAKHPLIPLNKSIFNLNCDGAGYNDTTLVTVMGFDHIDMQALVSAGAEPFNLKAGGDPVPQQGLYKRSDNFSFASRGVPAINLSPGVNSFDQELMKYYHQVADEAESLNFPYVTRFCGTFAHVAKLIADSKETPWWKEGDEFEEIGKELYGN